MAFRRVLHQAKPNPTVVLFLDGSRTHLEFWTLQKAKAKGIESLCTPPHCSDVIQPLDRGVFKPLKTAFAKLQKACIREGKISNAPRQFIENITTAWLTAVTAPNIITAFATCGLCPYNPHVFLSRCPAYRLRVEHVEDSMPQSGKDNQSSVCSSLGPSASQLTATPPATATIATQCSGRSINAAMKDDPSNLRLGGFCTSATFLEDATKRAEYSQMAAKGVPRGRSTPRSTTKSTTKSTNKSTNKSAT